MMVSHCEPEATSIAPGGPACGTRSSQRIVSGRLNRDCFCITLDHEALCRAAEQEIGDPQFCIAHLRTRPHLFSGTSLFVPESDIEEMLRIVQAIEAAARLPAYRDAVLAWAPEIARRDFGPHGVFMGYDFHLTDDGPRLIEVNSNAGGAFLNALLAKAQRACCVEVERALGKRGADDFAESVLRMFVNEWTLQRGQAPLRCVAIVDDRPAQQYLYPEFLLAQRLLQKAGLETLVVDAQSLRFEGGRLFADERPVDLVYNRLVDFSLEQAEHRALREAYAAGAVVLTPNPRIHALFADKRNLTVLSDAGAVARLGLPPAHLAALAGIPKTIRVNETDAQALWEARKTLFFKPAAGYGSKAVYRGDKLTKAVWADILRGDYIAQTFVAPSERSVRLEAGVEPRKVDVRLYVYDGQIQLSAARLYQGQTTNFRTPGGGFAPVFPV